jgi:hypothetical protein
MVDILHYVPSKAWVSLFDKRDRPTGICTMITTGKESPYSAFRETVSPADVLVIL